MWPFRRREKSMQQIAARGFWHVISEPFSGAWQRNIKIDRNAVLAFHAVFSCMTLIARDIAKLRVKLIERDASGVWTEVSRAAYSPVLRKPNGYQTRGQFWESWILSKLSHGNTYILKVRDNRGVVVALHVLDPALVRPLVSDGGAVFYEVQADNLSAGVEMITVPAREVIHDRFNCLFHPLVGVSPIMACGLAATQGINIQNNSAQFFGNAAVPGGILTAPGAISDETAERLKSTWESRYSGDNAGKIAVLGDGLKFDQLAVTAVDSQMVEQLRWTAEVVCSTFHVPPYKIGVGAMPAYNNVQALNIEYYSQCLQSLIEDAEACLDDGLGMAETIGVEFDLDGLLRMDAATQMDVLEKARSVLTLDERRARLDARPITGGATVYLQQQDHSIEAIAARDKVLIEQAEAGPPAAPAPEPTPSDADKRAEAAEGRAFFAEAALAFQKGLAHA